MSSCLCPYCGNEMPYISGDSNFCPNCKTSFYEGEIGACRRCGDIDLLSSESLCNYCQHILDKD